MISDFLVYQSKQLNPYLNLATEKILFEGVPKNTLILYLWQNENTVVVGKNQNPWAECNVELLNSDGGFVARRLSGGGAVFHDKGNLNFTFIANDEDFDVSRHFEIIKMGCLLCGIETKLSGRNDILAHGKKFSGNAFYHSAGRSYHHGTLLISSDREKLNKYLTPSAEKLNSKGVKSVNSRTINLCEISSQITVEKLQNALIDAAQKILGQKSKFLDEITAEQIETQASIFSDWDFIFGSTLPFSISVKARLSFGTSELSLNLKNGKISEVKLFTDALDTTLSDRLESTILGCEFALDSISERLENEFDPATINELLTLVKKALMQ